jgi:outer membrane lipoprotein-sorting protein
MKIFVKFAMAILGLILAIGFFSGGVAQQNLSAGEILKKSVEAQFPDIYISTMQFVASKPNQPDNASILKISRKSSDKAVAEVLAPPESKGQKIIRVGDEVKIFFPDICKVVPLTSKTPLLGTNFTSTDILRVDLVKDYNATLLGTETFSNKTAYKLELKAKDESVAYDRVLYWIAQQDFLPLKGEFYTQSGKLLRVLTISEPKMLGGATRMSKYVIEDALQVGTKTTSTIQTLEVLKDLPDELFSEEALLKSCEK